MELTGIARTGVTMCDELSPGNVRLNDGLGPLPTSAEDDAVVQARLSKTPAEAYERGYMDGAARERERCAKLCDDVTVKMNAECPRAVNGWWPDQVGYACIQAIEGPNGANNRIPTATQD